MSKEIAKIIRTELKEMGISSRQVSVKSEYAGYDSAINLSIKDLKVNYNTVKEIASKHEYYDRDERTGEILAGGNTYIRVEFDYETVQAEAEKLIPLATELVERYKDTSKNCIETIARKGDIEIKYFPNPEESYNKFIAVYRLTNDEFQHWETKEYYFSVMDTKLNKYNAQCVESIANALVYIINQYGIDFTAEVEELDETILEVICIPEAKKIENQKWEEEKKANQAKRILAENITPISIVDVTEQNIRVEGVFASLNKNDTIEEYIEEVERKNFIETCLINEVITLTVSDYEIFTHTFLTSQTWLDGKGGHDSDFETEKTEMYQLTEQELTQWRQQAYSNCIMIKAEGKDSILINPEGFSYARYVGFMEQGTTPKDPKPTKKATTTDNTTTPIKTNVVDLVSYKEAKETVITNTTTTILNKPTEPATKRQLWALYIVTKLITTNLVISKQIASELISKSMKGTDITAEVKKYLENDLSIAK